MKQIPETENAPVLRTDFSNPAAWEKICAAIRTPGEYGFQAYVEFIDDPDFAGLSKNQLLSLLPKNYNHSFIIVVDPLATSHPDYPLLIVDLYDQPGREFRAIPSQIQAVENNLSIANMDFDDFAESVDEGGVFRGFA